MKKQRLLKLADHLERGKLIQDKFDFSQLHTVIPRCGTSGCAMGEMPAVFPERCQFGRGSGLLRINGHSVSPSYGIGEAVAKFFGIKVGEAHFLFFPGTPGGVRFRHVRKPGDGLAFNANRRHVATRIRKFVKLGRTY